MEEVLRYILLRADCTKIVDYVLWKIKDIKNITNYITLTP